MARYTEAEKQEARALCVEIGLGEAHDRLDIPKPTLSRWLSDDERTAMHQRFQYKTSPASAAYSARWQDTRDDLKDRLGKVAGKALDKCEELVEAGKVADAQKAMTTCAIAIDKAQLLSGDATSIARVPWEPKQLEDEAAPRAQGLRAVS